MSEGEDRFAAMFNFSPDGIILSELASGVILEVNPKYCSLLGVPREELLGRNIRELSLWVDSAERNKMVELVQANGRLDNFEARYRTASGEIGEMLFSARVINVGGQLCLMGIGQDNAERKRLERELRNQSDFLSQVINNMGQGLTVTNTERKFEMVNPAAARMLGYSQEQLIGMRPIDLTAEDDRVAVNEARRRRMLGEITSLENHMIRADGSLLPIMATNSARIKDGQYAGTISVFTDLTDIKRAEAQRHDADLRFNKAFRASPIGINIFRLADGRSVDVNDAYLAMTGYQYYELVGHSAEDLNLLVDPEMHQSLIQSLHTKGIIKDQETALRTRSGEIRYVLFSIESFEMAGEMMGMELNVDITERRRLESELREQGDFLSQVINNMGLGLTVTNVERRFELVNPAAAKMLGYDPQQLIGMRPIDLSPDEDQPLLEQARERRLRGETITLESHMIRADGSQIPMLATYSPRMKDEKYAGTISVFTDLTELKKVEEQRHEAVDRFNKAFRASPIGINIFRLVDQCSLDCNEAYTALTGYTQAELLGHGAQELNLFFEPELIKVGTPAPLANHSTSAMETQIRTKSGETRHLLTSVESIVMEGEACGMLLCVDITDRKRAEAALQAAHDELEQRVLERTAELQAANADLEKASRARDEFLATMSHELRTPLTGILGLSQAMELNTYGELSQRQTTAVQNIEKSGQHLLELINQVLDFSKMQAGHLELQKESCTLDVICQSSLQMVNALLVKKRQELVYNITPLNIVLVADERRLRQVLINLLSNAIKFTPEAGRIELQVTGLSNLQEVLISVSDTGIGIKEEDFPRLFQPFKQLDSRLSRQFEGTGLGLALVKQLVELHGGRVEVSSVIGQGSRFTVSLPWHGL